MLFGTFVPRPLQLFYVEFNACTPPSHQREIRLLHSPYAFLKLRLTYTVLVGGGSLPSVWKRLKPLWKMNDCRKFRSLLNAIIPILLWIHTSYSDPGVSDYMAKMKAVRDKILNGYDKTIRPTLGSSNTSEVYTAYMPRQILDVDEEKGLFVLDSYFHMHWTDPRLTWDRNTEFDGNIQLRPDTIWVPDVSVHNSHSSQVVPMEDVMALVRPSGLVFWTPPMQTRTSCPALSEVTYPYDVVTCEVDLGSWVHDGWEVELDHADNRIYLYNFENINTRWELMVSNATLKKQIFTYEESAPYVTLTGVFPLRRRPLPEIEATRAPCILLMLLTLSMFWMPPDSSKKLAVGGISFLALLLMLVYVAWSTRFPLAVLFAVSFLQSTMYIVVVSILLQVLVIFNLCNISGPVRPPPAAMQLLSGPFGKYACLRSSPSNDNIPIDRMQLKEDSPSVMEPPTPKEDWILFAAGLDRLLFVLMSIAMIAIHHL